MAAGLLAACSSAPGNAETDRIATVVADAISYPRQEDIVGYASAANATNAAGDGRLTVIGMEESDAEELNESLGHLVFLVHFEGEQGGMFDPDPVTACYRAEFNFYGVIDRPHRIDCPADTTPVSLPAEEPAAPISVPDGADEVLEQVLAAAPARPSAAAVRESLLHSLPAAEADPATGVPASVTPPEVAVDGGADIGVALFQPEPRDCLLGSRVGEDVLVWRPARVQVQPGELSCDPMTALARSGTAPPH